MDAQASPRIEQMSLHVDDLEGNCIVSMNSLEVRRSVRLLFDSFFCPSLSGLVCRLIRSVFVQIILLDQCTMIWAGCSRELSNLAVAVPQRSVSCNHRRFLAVLAASHNQR